MKKLTLLLILFALVSCADENGFEKQDLNEIATQNSPRPTCNELPENKTKSLGYIVTDYIDWENVDYFSYKLNTGTVVDVLPPWFDGANAVIPDNVRRDYKSQDGWVLLHNFFSEEYYYYYPMIVLYNKYRGIMRTFYYHIQQYSPASSYVMYGLRNEGDYSGMLNFSGEFPVDGTIRKLDQFTIKSNLGSFGPSGASPGHWYCFDFEIAYDSLISSKSNNDILMHLKLWGKDVKIVEITGTLNADINGYIEMSGSGNLFQSLLGDFSFKSTGVSNSFSINNGTETKSSFEDKLQASIDSGLADAIGSGLGDLASSGLELFTNPISKLFNSILGTKGPTKNKINLKFAGKVDLNGSITSQNMIFNQPMIIPGTQLVPGGNGFKPHYNLPLGVFNISAKPKVYWQEYFDKENGIGYYKQEYNLDRNSFKVVLNPAIENELQIISIEKDFVFFGKYSGSPLPYNSRLDHRYYHYPKNNVVNIIDGNIWYERRSNQMTTYYKNITPEPYTEWKNGLESLDVDNRMIVRLTLKVQPNNGTDPVIFVKHFRPQYIKNQTRPYLDPNDWNGGGGMME
ncbi:MAG: hypothetical protein N4A59_06275 [Marinifilum sp.]|jgi:hypothetical protein|nr:hypothetical protein [Marinifilum sp.]